ncbi:MAG: hypothetical protein NVS3B10_03380 [Polyangiales bacterium]
MFLAHEDDGIIDLRALKSTPPATSATFGAFPMGSPFASEPPPAAFARDAGEGGDAAAAGPARASKGKTFGIAAGAALFLVLSAVGVGFAFRGEKPVKSSSAAATPAVAAPPPVVAPPAPVADPAPSSPATAPAADDTSAAADAPSAKKKKGAKGARAGAAKAKTSVAPSSPAASKPAPTKAADPCHCNGDFQCNIRCSANR